MSTFYLIRHATPASELLGNESVVPSDGENCLCERGLQEAERLAEHFKAAVSGAGSVKIISSSLRRARETADVISRQLGVDVSVDPRLDERSFDSCSPVTLGESARNQLMAYQSPLESVEGAETVAAHRKRVQRWFSENMEAPDLPQCAHVLVVSHGGTIEHLLGAAIGSLEHTLQRYFVPCPCAHFHQLTRLEPRKGWSVWRVDGLSMSA